MPESDGISSSICLMHPTRPAVARCPECRRFFCEECVTEHDGRLTCAQCLRSGGENNSESSGHGIVTIVIPVIQLALGLFVIWMLFYFTARFLILIPAPFHDGTVWE